MVRDPTSWYFGEEQAGFDPAATEKIDVYGATTPSTGLLKTRDIDPRWPTGERPESVPWASGTPAAIGGVGPTTTDINPELQKAYDESRTTKTDDGVFNVIREQDEFV